MKKIKNRKIYTPLIALCLSSTSVLAETNLYGSGEDVGLALDWLRTESVEVTVASKLKETVFDAPSSVTVFTEQEIHDLGVTNLYDLLNYVPGFQTFKNAENTEVDSVSIRGRMRSFDAREFLLLIDGQRVNEVNGAANFSNSLMTLDNVKQVEIIRGPGSALYGSNAFLGVISIITNPNKKNVTARASSFSGKDISVNYAGDLGEGYYSFFAKAFSDKGETYRNVTDQIGKTDDETRDPRNGIDLYTVAGYDDFSITLRHSHREYDDFFFTGFLGDDINHSEADHSFIKLTYQPILMEKLDLDINVSHAVTEWDAKGFLFPAGFELAPGFALSNRVIAGPTIKSSHTEIKVDASYPLSENHIINAGIGFAKQEINDSSLQSTHNLVTFEFQGDGNLHTFKGDDSFIDNEDRTISSAYFQDKLILDAVTLIAGVRADNYSDFGSTVNPRLAVIYSTDWKSRFKFMFGSAYRAPAFDELYVRNNPQVQGNKNLKPEEIKTIELAYFQRLGNTEFSATLFHNTISEIITTTPITGSFSANTVINQGEEKVKGLEFEFNKPINNHLVMRGSYTMITSGVDNFSPNRSGSLIANYHQDRFNINLRTSYHGRIASIPTRGGYYLLNCAVNYKVNPSVSVQLSGQNLSNKDYLSPSSKTNLLQTPNRGRNVVAELEYKF